MRSRECLATLQYRDQLVERLLFFRLGWNRRNRYDRGTKSSHLSSSGPRIESALRCRHVSLDCSGKSQGVVARRCVRGCELKS